MSIVLAAAAAGGNVDAGKAIALALGIGLGVARRRRRHRQHLRLDDPVGRPPAGAARRAPGDHVARLRADRGRRLLRPHRRPARPTSWSDATMLVAANALIQVVPGLMIWTIVSFGITFFVLKRVRLRPDPEDHRRAARPDPRSRSTRPTTPAPRRGACSRSTAQLIGQARTDAEEILAEARRVAESQRERVREETEADRQRRLEETRRQVEAETRRALEQIRAEVADLTLIAATKVTGKVALRRRPQAADRGRDQRARLLRAREGARADGRPPHVRPRALRGGEGRRPARAGARGARTTSPPRSTRCRSSPRARQPRARQGVKAQTSSRRSSATDADELTRNFVRLLAEKGRAGELRRSQRELDALVAAEERDPPGRADDRLRALRGRVPRRSSPRSSRLPAAPCEATRERRPGADRRPRPPGRLDARRRVGPRPPRTTTPRTRVPVPETEGAE